MEKHRTFDWRIAALFLGLLFSLALIVVFTFRAWHTMARARAAEPIQPWMSVPYVAHSYRVPAYLLFQALGLPDNRYDRRPIAIIARDEHRSVQSLIQTLYQAILQANPSIRLPTPLPSSRPTEGAP